MTFKDAANFIMPFGKHKGRTLQAIVGDDDDDDDEGFLYLDCRTQNPGDKK